ncbi:MAG TPA: PIN domain-containing protein [Bryobacteraceae bacterium]|nr:PIN domain-containing protein [Bryobacteraceae bacterium]
MQVLIDTNIWSFAFRRTKTDLSVREAAHAAMLGELIRQDRARLIGPIRQELLSGIREQAQFDRLRNALRSFPDEPLAMDDFEGAVQCGNRCRSKGISGSPIDFLICAVALHRDWQIFTTDPDFGAYAKVLALRLLTAR